MNKIIAVLMISVLFLNLAPHGFPEAISLVEQAQADAAADMKPGGLVYFRSNGTPLVSRWIRDRDIY